MNQQAYIKETAKKLSCNRDKRAEFTRQLASDIESALESGESWDAIQKRLGTPTEIAREMNESLGETAVAYRQKTRRILGLISGLAAVILVAVILLFTVPGIREKKPPEQAEHTSSPYATQTNEPLSNDTARSLSNRAIEQFSDGNYKTLIDQSDDKLKDILSVETLKQVREQMMPDAGEFQGIKESNVVRINEENASYVTVQTQARYERQTVTFTLSWNDREELCGFYLK